MQLLTIKEAASILRVRVPRAYSLARKGILPVVRLGRQIRIDEEALRDWVRSGGQSLSNRLEP